MQNTIKLIIVAIFVQTHIFALPVTKTHQQEPISNETVNSNLPEALEYERYLREVVETLENDPEFRKKLDKAPEADIRNGKIAQELEYVSRNVRSKLDEIKRKEVKRLRELATKQFEYNNEIDREHLKINDHIDHRNEHTFEIKDLKKLILKTSHDLAEADKKRRDEFKQYEMQKEFEKQSVLEELDAENKRKYEEELKLKKEKHQVHDKVHHPGNKAQLEEVWEKQDHMDGQDFDPKAFFMIHDVDGNGFWDETELKALFVKELDKVYQSGLPEDDMRERAEEMERMREHVFSEIDANRDGLVSFEEFLAQTKRDEFQKDSEWETVDNVPQFTHDEYLEFEKKRKAEVDKLVSQGLLPSHPNVPQGYQPRAEVHPQGHIPQYNNANNYNNDAQHHQVPNNQPVYNQQNPSGHVAEGYHPRAEVHPQDHIQQYNNPNNYNNEAQHHQVPNNQPVYNTNNQPVYNTNNQPSHNTNNQPIHNQPNPNSHVEGYQPRAHPQDNMPQYNNPNNYNNEAQHHQVPNNQPVHNQQDPNSRVYNEKNSNPSVGYNQTVHNQPVNHNDPKQYNPNKHT